MKTPISHKLMVLADIIYGGYSKEDLKKIGKKVGANAIRFVLRDYNEYNCKVGDTLNNRSHVWKAGTPTYKELNGLCFVLLKNLNKVYCYDTLLFTYAEKYESGDDPDEIIVLNPVILHKINKEQPQKS